VLFRSVVYAQDRNSGNKLLAGDAWFVKNKSEINAFLLKDQAEAWARANGGNVLDFDAVKTAS